jgi:sulfide:quinone oxidoreductase
MDGAFSESRARVLIAGGGFAALEAAVALRALAGERVELTLITPGSRFAYRPSATAEIFEQRPQLAYDLPELLAGIGALHEVATLRGVAPRDKKVRLYSGKRLSYDSLILAVGARSRSGIAGAVTFRDQRDVTVVRRILDDVEHGDARRLVFAVPSRQSWALPAYELALLFADRVRDLLLDAHVTLVTPEAAPLEAFGVTASQAVGQLLLERDITVVTGVTPHGVRRDGALELEFDAPVPADRVITVPDLRGQKIPGIPGSWLGFVPTDTSGRVEGLQDVYAAGDMTTFPIKQGGIATQQADRIARTIAETLGVPVHDAHGPRILQARLLGGDRPLFLRCELDDFGHPSGVTIDRLERSDPVRRRKVLARYLEPYLAHHRPIDSLAVA